MTPEWHRAVRQALRLQRRQSIALIGVFVVAGVSTVRGYIAAYPTPPERLVLARSLGANTGFQALYGIAHRIDTVGGFTAWRLSWMLGALTGVWGLLASTRLIRGEEETGRRELMLAGAIGSRSLLAADLTAVAVPLAACMLCYGAAIAAAGVPVRGAFVIAGGVVAPGLLFGAVGAFTSQLFADRRHALGSGSALLGASFLVRVAADGAHTLGWLRWASPLGWVENLRPFAGTDLVAIVPVVIATCALVIGAFVALRRRDFATGLVATRERGHPDSVLLKGVTGFAVKGEWRTVLSWAIGVGAFAFVFGLLANDVATFMRTQTRLHLVVRQLGLRSLDRPQDFLGLMFTFFALPIAIYSVTQVSAAREEEATGRLEALLARAVSRRRWLLSRVLVAAAGALAVTLVPALAAWLGAALQHSGVRLVPMVVAALNCLPATALFFGVAVLCLGVAPRLTAGVGLGTVIAAYLLQLVGAIVNAPAWLLDLTPFHHLAPTPAAPVNLTAALVMLAIGLATTAGGIAQLSRRDLVGA